MRPPIIPFFERGDKVHFFSFDEDKLLNGTIAEKNASGSFCIDTSISSAPFCRYPEMIYYGWVEEE